MGSSLDLLAPPSSQERQSAFDAALKSSTFTRNPRLSDLLRYLCVKSFAGESATLKEYAIATDVFGRPPDFDQSTDSIVRVEMHRLRKKLKEFYAIEGADQPLEIVIQSGHYVPEFMPRRVETPSSAITPVPLVNEPVVSSAGPKRRWLPLAIAAAAAMVALAAVFMLTGRHNSTSRAARTYFASSDAVRILCGRISGEPLRDREGNVWTSDAFFQGGVASDVPDQVIYRTRNAALFRSVRTGNFSYRIPLKPGVYELHLFFADTAYKPGISMEGGENTRFFNISLNSVPLLSNFDVIANAGASTAYERIFKDVEPGKDGKLMLTFSNDVGQAILNALEIVPAERHRMRPIRLSIQESGFVDKSGVSWQPDNYFLNGRTIAKFGIAAGPVDAQVYARERFGNFSYAIPAAPGKYRLNLHFAETFFGPGEQGGGGAGDRLFDIDCNGVALLQNFDIYREAGEGHELIKTFHGIEPNAQGNVLLSFVPRKNYAMVSAIELIDETNQ